MAKNLPANMRDMDLIPGSGRSSGEGYWQPIPISLPGKSQGQWSLVIHGVTKESDTP